MTTAYEVPADLLIKRLAEYIKNNITQVTPPEWSFYVKTGAHRERPPYDKNWWYLRAASLLRKIYLYGPIGVNELKSMYGGARSSKHAIRRRREAGGCGIRKVLQQLENAGLVTKLEKKGRILTSKGRGLIDRLSQEILETLAEDKPELKKYL